MNQFEVAASKDIDGKTHGSCDYWSKSTPSLTRRVMSMHQHGFGEEIKVPTQLHNLNVEEKGPNLHDEMHAILGGPS
ncbi:hypothetical protein ACLB2K_001498 [Fragaria x ananassa]